VNSVEIGEIPVLDFHRGDFSLVRDSEHVHRGVERDEWTSLKVNELLANAKESTFTFDDVFIWSAAVERAEDAVSRLKFEQFFHDFPLGASPGQSSVEMSSTKRLTKVRLEQFPDSWLMKAFRIFVMDAFAETLSSALVASEESCPVMNT
jgi:hypothetical protein